MSVTVTDAHTGAVLHFEPAPLDPAAVLRATQARLTETTAALIVAEATLREMRDVVQTDWLDTALVVRGIDATLRQIAEVRRA